MYILGRSSRPFTTHVQKQITRPVAVMANHTNDINMPGKSVEDLPYHIIGAGIVGMSTAYYMTKAGLKVEVIDATPGPCLETSYGNQGVVLQTQFGHFAHTGIGKLINPSDQDCKISTKALDMDFLRFGYYFLKNTVRSKFDSDFQRISKNQAFKDNVTLINQLIDDVDPDMHRPVGRFQVRTNPDDTQELVDTIKQYPEFNYEVTEIEALKNGRLSNAVTGINYTSDHVVHCNSIGTKIAQYLAAEHEVGFRFGTNVIGFERSSSGIDAIITKTGEKLKTKGIIIACGPFSNSLFQELGYRARLAPMKGHTITYDLTDKDRAILPQNVCNIVDATSISSHFSVFQDTYRIGAFGDFVGYDTSVEPKRWPALQQLWRENIPDLEYKNPRIWAGLRPMAPDQNPMIGKFSDYSNVYINTGQGEYGMCLGFFSGHLLAQLIKDPAKEEMNQFSPMRFF